MQHVSDYPAPLTASVEEILRARARRTADGSPEREALARMERMRHGA